MQHTWVCNRFFNLLGWIFPFSSRLWQWWIIFFFIYLIPTALSKGNSTRICCLVMSESDSDSTEYVRRCKSYSWHSRQAEIICWHSESNWRKGSYNFLSIFTLQNFRKSIQMLFSNILKCSKPSPSTPHS